MEKLQGRKRSDGTESDRDLEAEVFTGWIECWTRVSGPVEGVWTSPLAVCVILTFFDWASDSLSVNTDSMSIISEGCCEDPVTT